MDIGGSDVFIPLPDFAKGRDVINACVDEVKRSHWPNLHREDNFSEGSDWKQDKRFPDLLEALIYKEASCESSWRELGYVPELIGTLLHFLAKENPTELTIVLDDRPTDADLQLVERMRKLIMPKMAIFRVRPGRTKEVYRPPNVKVKVRQIGGHCDQVRLPHRGLGIV
jgi:hypothetical protein